MHESLIFKRGYFFLKSIKLRNGVLFPVDTVLDKNLFDKEELRMNPLKYHPKKLSDFLYIGYYPKINN